MPTRGWCPARLCPAVRPKGTGTFVAKDTLIYEGEFKDGNKHGNGMQRRFATGDVYDGEWRGDKKHGAGTYTFAANKRVYADDFVKDLPV